MVDASDLVKSLSEQLGLPDNLTVSQITDHKKLRDAIDNGDNDTIINAGLAIRENGTF